MPTIEKTGLALLSDKLPKFYVPNLNEKKQILNWLGVDRKFVRSFDGLLLETPDFQSISSREDFSIIEVKVTGKKLPNLSHSPKGFFFSLSANEEMLFYVLGVKALMCLVSIHEESELYFITDWPQFQKYEMKKRIVYEVNML